MTHLTNILNDLIHDYNRGEADCYEIAADRINQLHTTELNELLDALQQSHDMLLDKGMRDESVGMAGINMVLKKYKS